MAGVCWICGGVHVVYQTSIIFFALVPLVSMNVPPVVYM